MLPDRSILIGQKLVENAKIQMRHFEQFSNNVDCSRSRSKKASSFRFISLHYKLFILNGISGIKAGELGLIHFHISLKIKFEG